MVVDRLAQVDDDPLAELVDEIDPEGGGQGEDGGGGGGDQEAGQQGLLGVHPEAAVDQPPGGDGQAQRGRRRQHHEQDAQQGVDRVGLQIGRQLGQRPEVLAVEALEGGGVERLLEQMPRARPANGGGRSDLGADHAPVTQASPVMVAPVLTRLSPHGGGFCG